MTQELSSHNNVVKLPKIILPKNFSIQFDDLPVINYGKLMMGQVCFAKAKSISGNPVNCPFPNRR